MRSALCLGVIGIDELRVCWNTAASCKICGHQKNRFVLGCAAAYCIPAKNQHSMGYPATFKFPLLDESEMTPEVRMFMVKHGPKTSLTTQEWESYMPQALRDFDLQERGVGGGIPEEKSDDSKDNESQDDLSLGNIPSLMLWDNPYEAPAPGLGIGLSEFEFEDTSGRQEVVEERQTESRSLAIRPARTPRMLWITCGCLFVRWLMKLTG